MSKVQGKVAYIDSYSTKTGKTMYSIKLAGEEKGAGLGMYPPRDIVVGDYVEYEVEMNGQYKNVARGSLKKIDASEVPAQVPSSGGSQTKTYVANSFDDRQAVISKQACLNTAIQMTKMALDAGAINLGTSKAGQLEIIEATMWSFAQKFHEFSTGEAIEVPEVSAKPKATKPAAKPAPKPEPPADDEWADEIPDDL